MKIQKLKIFKRRSLSMTYTHEAIQISVQFREDLTGTYKITGQRTYIWPP